MNDSPIIVIPGKPVDAEPLIPESEWYPFYRHLDGTLSDKLFPWARREDWALFNTPPDNEHCYGDNYVVGLPTDEDRADDKEGWFPLGSVSLVFGSTGAGKSTWCLQLISAQLKGERVCGHQTYSLPYIVLMQDRNEHSLNRTLRRMGIDRESVPLRILPMESYKQDPAVVVEEYYLKERERYEAEIKSENWREAVPPPRIVYIEGLDIWVPDASNKDAVAPLLKRLETVATHYNLAIVATTGSPKMKPKDVYQVTRDSAFGSQVWGRMVEMVQVLANEETGERYITVMPRNGRYEKFTTTFQAGRLTVKEGIQVVIGHVPNRKDGTKREAFMAWWKEGRLAEEAEELFGISRRTFYLWQTDARAGGQS
jgi:AAA domain